MEQVYWYGGHEVFIKEISKAEGCFVYDGDGKEYVDMESGVWSLPLGHRCKSVDDALRNQMDKCFHTGYCYSDPVVNTAANMLLKSVDMPDGKCVFLTSGSEAVEVGVQVVKAISGEKLLTFEDSFLGSHGSASARSAEDWHLFNWLDCGDCVNGECDSCMHFSTIPFDDIGGFVFEPGSSSGLVRFPPEKLIDTVVQRVRENGGFIHVNEITTGLGRTGRMYGYMHYGVKPDIVSVGKGVGNGYPVSAVMFNQKVAALMVEKHYKLSQSHQNDPAGASVVMAVLKELAANKIPEQAESKGKYLLNRLNKLASKHKIISDVRGRGLMVSITFDGVSDEVVYDVFLKLFKAGFIIVKRPGLKVFRIDPPLVISIELLDKFVKELDFILSALD